MEYISAISVPVITGCAVRICVEAIARNHTILFLKMMSSFMVIEVYSVDEGQLLTRLHADQSPFHSPPTWITLHSR